MSSDQYTPSDEDVYGVWTNYQCYYADDGYGPRGADKATAEMDRYLANIRRRAAYFALALARSRLAGEDTVKWARNARGSSMSYPHAIGIIDDLIEDLDGEETRNGQ